MARWELVFRLKDSPSVERTVPVQDDSAIRAWQEYQADGVARPITAGTSAYYWSLDTGAVLSMEMRPYAPPSP
jgi:hypothetical protein